MDAAKRNQSLQVHLCNAYTLSLVDRDARLRAALAHADLNLPDGAPVAWIGRKEGTNGPVRGPSLVADVCAAGVPHGLGHFFLGGAPGVAEEMGRRLANYSPGLRVVGNVSPPFRPLSPPEIHDLARTVADSGANVLWIGLGTPVQDYAVAEFAGLLSMPIVPVGAAFDFWSGNVTEAPVWLHGSGLEWTYRLAREPRRLWRRYLFGNPRFLLSHLRHK